MITDKNYADVLQVLVHADTSEPVSIGDCVHDFRGDSATIADGRAPHKSASTGFVYTTRGQSYAGVFGLKWVDYDSLS